MNDEQILSATESLCPQCLKKIAAFRVVRNENIYLKKSCPEHGDFEAVLWRGKPSYQSWTRSREAAYPEPAFTEIEKGCPYDCGLCPEHRQRPCCVLLEITGHCNLKCPICYVNAGMHKEPDPDLGRIKVWYQRLLEGGGPFNIQLSGGEPTLRHDLPEIIALGRDMGFSFIQLNTNGLRLANEPLLVKRLQEAGLSTVFMQFDGTEDIIYQQLRGRPLLKEKLKAIRNCAEHHLGVVLVPTIVPGVNKGNIGAIIEFALNKLSVVRGVHFQPISYFGRYPLPPRDSDRITLPEVMQEIEAQTQGLIQAANLLPSGCEHALCSFHGDFVLMEDGTVNPLTRPEAASCCQIGNPGDAVIKARRFVAKRWTLGEPSNCCNESKVYNLGGWDEFLERIRTHAFSITAMAFQDAWNIDLERLHECCVHVLSPSENLIPFCAYNLTGSQGNSLYR